MELQHINSEFRIMCQDDEYSIKILDKNIKHCTKFKRYTLYESICPDGHLTLRGWITMTWLCKNFSSYFIVDGQKVYRMINGVPHRIFSSKSFVLFFRACNRIFPLPLEIDTELYRLFPILRFEYQKLIPTRPRNPMLCFLMNMQQQICELNAEMHNLQNNVSNLNAQNQELQYQVRKAK